MDCTQNLKIVFITKSKNITKILQDCSVERIEEIKTDGHRRHIIENCYKEVKKFCKKVGNNKLEIVRYYGKYSTYRARL